MPAKGMSACQGEFACQRGVCLPGGCLPARGVSARQGEFACQGGVYLRGGCLPRGVSARHPPVDRMTDSCENITLPQLHCGR